jgi:hypothetical protein
LLAERFRQGSKAALRLELRENKELKRFSQLAGKAENCFGVQ